MRLLYSGAASFILASAQLGSLHSQPAVDDGHARLTMRDHHGRRTAVEETVARSVLVRWKPVLMQAVPR